MRIRIDKPLVFTILRKRTRLDRAGCIRPSPGQPREIAQTARQEQLRHLRKYSALAREQGFAVSTNNTKKITITIIIVIIVIVLLCCGSLS